MMNFGYIIRPRIYFKTKGIDQDNPSPLYESNLYISNPLSLDR